MEPMFNAIEDFDDLEDFEEEREFLERSARRKERWIQEKKRRQQKLKILKLLLGFGAICIIIVACVICAKPKEAADSEKNQESLAMEQNMEETVTEQMPEEIMAEQIPEEIATEQSLEEQVETVETPIYKFEATADTMNISSESVISSHAILVDAATDTIVATKGAYDRISPASMTKVLTVLVAAEAIEETDLDDTFTMTLEITDYAYVNDCSSVGFLNEEVVTVKDLFYGTILPSGGDAAVGLATYVAGSHEAFVDMMNEKLEELGLSETAHFTNCVGLYDENHYCTIYDMAVIMKAAMQNEWCREVLSAHTYTTVPTPQHPEGITISNWFLRRIEDKDTGGLVVGGKTGYVVQSGNCAVSYEEYADGTPYICVTAGSTSSWRCIYDHVEIYNRYISDEE